MRRRYTGLYCAWCDAPVPGSEGLPPLPEFDVVVAYCSEECGDAARFYQFVRRVAAATFDELGELQAGYPEYCARLLQLGREQGTALPAGPSTRRPRSAPRRGARRPVVL